MSSVTNAPLTNNPSTLDLSTLNLSSLSKSPLQKLHSSFLDEAEVQLYVKRDDLIHPLFGGNKWRKLKYNLNYAREQNYNTLLTFGGAWSNHIYATAAAAQYFGFDSIGIIRGEQHTPLNATLTFAENCGMQLHYVSRTEYRQKHQTDYQKRLQQQYGNIYILPEGGSNALALQGCAEIVAEINHELSKPFDVICCASGTGATLAGLITALKSGQSAIGFSALKGGDFLKKDVANFLNSDISEVNWQIETAFHFAGYAKIDERLISFMRAFKMQYGFALDAVYTAKMFYGLFKQIEQKAFKPGTTIIAVHSGGLQGNTGFNL